MQKVEGSNPFSRFDEGPAPAGPSAFRLRVVKIIEHGEAQQGARSEEPVNGGFGAFASG